MTDRRRNLLILLIVAGPGRGARWRRSRSKPTRLGPGPQGRRGAHLPGASPRPRRKSTPNRWNARSTSCASASTSSASRSPKSSAPGQDEIDVALPDVSNVARAEEEVGKTAQLYFYDWETNVIGPNGKPRRPNGSGHRRRHQRRRRRLDRGPDRVPGGAAGRQTAGDHARQRHHLDRRAARPNRRTAASTAAGTCSTRRTKRSCSGGEETSPDAETEARTCYADGYTTARPGAKLKAVRVNPGTVVVAGPPDRNRLGKVINPSPNS